MMRVVVVAVAVLVALSAGGHPGPARIAAAHPALVSPRVSASSSSGGPQPVSTPVPPPGGPPHPAIAIEQRTDEYDYLHTLAYPSDFHFGYEIDGAGFKPNEQVTISIRNGNVPTVTVMAGGSGWFSARVPLTWVFCGPSASHQPAPVFTVIGNRGSRAQVAEQQPACPLLQVDAASIPPSAGPTGGGGGILYGTPVTPPTVSAQPLATAQTTPVLPALLHLRLTGFGFVPGEYVTVQAIHLDRYPSLPAVHIVADASGRIEFSTQAYYLFSACGPDPSSPQLVASGDKGTSAWTYIPMGQLGAPCSRPVPTSTPKARPTSRSLTLAIRRATVRVGQMEIASIRTGEPGIAVFTVHYRRGGGMRRVVHIGAGHVAVVRWRIPRFAAHGLAHVRLRLEPQQHTVTKAFYVR